MANKKEVAKNTDAAAVQNEVAVAPEEGTSASQTETPQDAKGVKVKVNPELDTNKVTIPTNKTDENGKRIVLNFEKGKTYGTDEAYLEAKDYDETPYLVKV